MTFPLHPEHLEAIYECLRALPPFNRWKLPHGEDVLFRTTERQDARGEYRQLPSGDHEIMISTACCGHFDTIVMTVAHEMIHLHQRARGRDTAAQHNAAFVRTARRVARMYGWDPLAF